MWPVNNSCTDNLVGWLGWSACWFSAHVPTVPSRVTMIVQISWLKRVPINSCFSPCFFNLFSSSKLSKFNSTSPSHLQEQNQIVFMHSLRLELNPSEALKWTLFSLHLWDHQNCQSFGLWNYILVDHYKHSVLLWDLRFTVFQPLKCDLTLNWKTIEYLILQYDLSLASWVGLIFVLYPIEG